MYKPKKILAISLKLILGLISFYIIYIRLASVPHLGEQFQLWLQTPSLFVVLGITLLLMPLNWGIECFKWKLITMPVESISYSTSVKSVLSGICVGNIAPGRAMEFLAKIFFFKPANRPVITVLHFINGMFQMLITVVFGLCAILIKINQYQTSSLIIYLVIAFGLMALIFFCWAITHVDYIQKKLSFFKWFKHINNSQIIKPKPLLVAKLFGLSLFRYLVFTSQFYLIYSALFPSSLFFQSFASIAAYFMFTSLVPMISVIEPAIRAAIALFVFNSAGDATVNIVLASTWVWMVNVVVPSLFGYVIILKEKVYFKSGN